jgi:hypothetical protein
MPVTKASKSTPTLDVWYTYQFIKRLSTDWVDTEAYKLGLLDDNGKKIRSPKNTKERNALTLFDRLIFNMKRILGKFGLKSKISNFAAAIVLLKEQDTILDMEDKQVHVMIKEEIKFLRKNSSKTFSELVEDVPTNATGSAVAGTGSDTVHWAPVHPTNKRKRKQIDGLAFLRRRKYLEKQQQLTAAEKMIKKAKEQHA